LRSKGFAERVGVGGGGVAALVQEHPAAMAPASRALLAAVEDAGLDLEAVGVLTLRFDIGAVCFDHHQRRRDDVGWLLAGVEDGLDERALL
jgi:hypothetical protein